MLSATFLPTENPLKNTYHQPLDVTIVFGQGPIKPLILEESLTSEQHAAWSVYKTDPLRKQEPEFFVIEQDMPSDIFDRSHEDYWKKIQSIRTDTSFSEAEKTARVEWILLIWQRWGRFSLKSIAKQNAVAAGIALLTGLTNEVILSGGRTLPAWKRDEFIHRFRMEHPELNDPESADFKKRFDLFVKYSLRWPSEAEVMADMITHNFGEAYEEKTGRSITEVLHLETASTNTLENVTNVLNTYAHLLGPDKKIGFLGSDFHLERIAVIAHRFRMIESPGAQLSAQKLLAGTADARQKQELKDLFTFYTSAINPWMQERIENEKRWITGLTVPEYLTYWLGYTFTLDDPRRVAEVLRRYQHGPWRGEMEDAFREAGLDFHRFSTIDLAGLAENHPTVYATLREKLATLTHPDHRSFPSQP